MNPLSPDLRIVSYAHCFPMQDVWILGKFCITWSREMKHVSDEYLSIVHKIFSFTRFPTHMFEPNKFLRNDCYDNDIITRKGKKNKFDML